MTEKEKSKIEQISAEPKTISVDGVEFDIHPLTNAEYLRIQNTDMGQSAAMKKLIMMTLKKDDSSISEEQFMKAPLKLGMKVLQATIEVNGLEDFFNQGEQEQILQEMD